MGLADITEASFFMSELGFNSLWVCFRSWARCQEPGLGRGQGYISILLQHLLGVSVQTDQDPMQGGTVRWQSQVPESLSFQ